MGECVDEVLKARDAEVETTKDGTAVPKEKLHELDIELLNGIENKFHELMAEYPNDNASLMKEFNEWAEVYISDAKFESARYVSDLLLTNRQIKAVTSLTDVKDFKKSARMLLDITEGDRSVETSTRGMKSLFRNTLMNDLRKTGMYDSFVSGNFDPELYRIKTAVGRGETDLSAFSTEARSIWSTIVKTNKIVHRVTNAAGLNVKYRNDFLVGRSYSAEKIIALGEGDIDNARTAFVQLMRREYVSIPDTFAVPKTKIASLRKQFKGEELEKKITEVMASRDVSINEKLGEMFDDIVGSQKNVLNFDEIGRKNHLTRLKGRKIVFKDGDVEYKFNQEYGNGQTLFETINNQIETNGRSAGVYTHLGTRPDKSYEAIASAWYDHWRGKIPEEDLQRHLTKSQHSYNEVVQPTHTPSSNVKKAINMVRGLQAFSKLGSSIFAALWDSNVSAFHYAVRTNGNQFAGMYEGLKASMMVMSKQQRKELAELMNIDTYFTDPAILMGGHAGDYNTGMGKISAGINNIFMKAAYLTGVPWQTEVSRTINGILQTKAFQKMLDAPDSLTNLQKLAMKEFDLSVDDLKFISKHASKTEKLNAVSSFDILKIDSKHFHENPLVAAKKRQALFDKHTSYIDSAVYKGTPTPTAKTKRQMGKHRGNPHADVFSVVMQFKETAWKIAWDNMQGFNKLHEAGGNTAVASGLGQYMMLAMPMYLAYEGARAVVGNKQRPDEKLLEILEGGGDGREMFWDFMNKSSIAPLFTDAAERMTSPSPFANFAEFAAGPSVSMLDDFSQILKREDKAGAAGNFVKRNLAPNSWIPLKAFDNYYGWYDTMSNRTLTPKEKK